MAAFTPDELAALERMEEYNSGRFGPLNPMGFAGLGYQTLWAPSLHDGALVANAVARLSDAATFIGNSVTSVAVGTGPKTWVANTNAPWVPGLYLSVVSGTNQMSGFVTAYNSTTGLLTIDVDAAYGTGAFATWTVFPSGRGTQGIKGDQGDPGPVGAGSTINVQQGGVVVTVAPRAAINFIGATVTDDPVNGRANVTIPSATTTVAGIVELATTAEAQSGTDGDRAVTPVALASVTATETRRGLVEIATAAEVASGTDADRAVTPARLAGWINGATAATPVADDKLIFADTSASGAPRAATVSTFAALLGASMVPESKTANYAIAIGDKGKAIDLIGTTSRTFTLPSAVTVGAGWYVFLKNSGDDVFPGPANPVVLTIAAASGQTINSLTSCVEYLGGALVLMSTGAAWSAMRLTGGFARFTQSGAFVVPADCRMWQRDLIGGGCSGEDGAPGGTSGRGGSAGQRTLMLQALVRAGGFSIAVTIGAGGLNGPGGNTTVDDLIAYGGTARGGGPAQANVSDTNSPLLLGDEGARKNNIGSGGAGRGSSGPLTSSNGGCGEYGGGGGGGNASSGGHVPGNGGSSLYGAGGGGGGAVTNFTLEGGLGGSCGSYVSGGGGALGSNGQNRAESAGDGGGGGALAAGNRNGGTGGVPGGGGGGGTGGTVPGTRGAGGRGEARIWYN